ncbi:DNA mismatch repair protein [Haematococcus lacustris]|uniref:DNA mismatch repair protein n=1 Tax=Haematococcus lacustris TaxID=44745 RepID=A0A6A0A6H8_HAELA|nr:DNA mismatch repair protein [Haematococcus lacustris]
MFAAGRAIDRNVQVAGGVACRWAQVEAALEVLSTATDWREAEATGRVIPAAGVDAAYDEALAAVADVEGRLAEYLQSVRGRVSAPPRSVVYISMNKDSHIIELPESVKVPSEFSMVGQRKGFKRYSSNALAALRAELSEAEEAKEAASGAILQGLVRRFSEGRGLWSWAVDSIAELDALMSLASHALNTEGGVCRPTLAPHSPDSPPVFSAQGLRHPAGLPGRIGSFVPNDIQLGGPAQPPFIVLTGPNMGGKSTLLRQTCLAALMAQVGACVPADALTLTPVDAIFVRMGAKDHIMTGQSTFFVELAETAAMLEKASRSSLVALDELGRGTATLDGAAIASAVF